MFYTEDMAQDASGEEGSNAYDKLLRSRTLFLSKEIDKDVASNIISLLLWLNYQSENEKITFYILSPGGDVGAFLAIYDVMQMIAAPIETICVGEASSAAAIILAAGSKGLRKASPNSRIMIHQVQVESPDASAMSSSDLDNYTKEVNKENNMLINILSRHTGQLFDNVYKDCKIDKYMSAKEAKDYGLIDEIIKNKKIVPPLKKPKKRKKK